MDHRRVGCCRERFCDVTWEVDRAVVDMREGSRHGGRMRR